MCKYLLSEILNLLRHAVLLLLLLRLLLVLRESGLDLVQRRALYLHGHAQVALVLLPVDVVQEVDGVLHDAVTDVAVIPEREDKHLV